MRPSKPKVIAPNWTKEEIVAAAGRLGKQYEDIVGRDYILMNGLHFDDVYEKLLFPKFNIDLYEDDDLGKDADGNQLLGRYDVADNAAHLDRSISREANDPRRIFTCWHEVAGHGALQGSWLRKQLRLTGEFESIDVTEFSLSASIERRLEWQANLFASRLAAPDWLVNYAIRKTFRPNRPFIFYEPCIYWLDVQGLAIRKFIVDPGDLCGWIGSKISGYFGGLSGEAIGYRIANLGWVQDRTAPDLHLRRAVRSKAMVGSLLTV
ncbi:MAG: hypothetical protein ABSB74_00595 [Tepidisphaeraceae bacterium]